MAAQQIPQARSPDEGRLSGPVVRAGCQGRCVWFPRLQWGDTGMSIWSEGILFPYKKMITHQVFLLILEISPFVLVQVTHNIVVIWVNFFFLLRIRFEIYSKNLARAIVKVLLMKFS